VPDIPQRDVRHILPRWRTAEEAGDIYADSGRVINVPECYQESYYEHLVFQFWEHHPGAKLKLAGQATEMLWSPEVGIEGAKIDPNRMFSREGAEKNLRLLNPNWSEAQISNGALALERDRHKFLHAIRPPRGGRIVALHNNSNGYSVESEVAISDRTSLKDAKNPHEFFLATNSADFDRLAVSPFNVVLQNAAPKDDDGSFSRLAARLGIRYINLECGLGKTQRQRELLGWLEQNLA